MITEFSKYKKGRNIAYWYNGQKKYETYFLNGKYHREDGPAYQSWYSNGQKEFEIYYLNGKKHREDGIAFQMFGQKEYEYYYLNDKEYTRKEWIEKLKEIGSQHYKEQKILYDSEKYNL